MAKSIYQSEEYKKALMKSKAKLIEIDEDFFAVEKNIKLGFSEKKVLEARGTPSKKSMILFQEISKKYFYGIISPCVINYDKEMFSRIKYLKVENWTILIDLRKSKEELWNALEKKSSRWGVKTANKNGLEIDKNAGEKEINEFYKIYKKTAEEGGFDAENREFLDSLIKSDIAKLFLVKRKDKVVAGGLLLLDRENNYTILDLTASSAEGFKFQAMPLLYWEIILFSKENGFNSFDLGGYDREAGEGEKTYNVNKFKERFGGQIVEQPIYSTNRKYVFLRGLLKRMRFMRKWYRKWD
jgi:lipid II:glycine glycyltransferase (peptidoglycan interpeptide bridge formation enzyme)